MLMLPEEIHARWPRGAKVRHVSAGWIGTITDNRIYATDCGAYIAIDGRPVGVVHWSHLERIDQAEEVAPITNTDR